MSGIHWRLGWRVALWLGLAWGVVGCGGGSAVRSEFYAPGAAAAIAGQSHRVRVQADSPELAEQIAAYAREKLDGILPLAADGAASVDVTFLHGDTPARNWDTDVGGHVGVSNYGTSVGVGVGVTHRVPKYPSMVLAVKDAQGRRLWLGTCWLDTGAEKIRSLETAGMVALDRLTARLRSDLAEAR
jgi:hypothetical protein